MTVLARVRELLARPWLASLALLVVYGGLSLLMDPNGYLGTDTGVKVATLEAMDRADTVTPDVGYWADEWDPDGDVHPFRDAKPREDGSWVAVTTLPLIEAAHPLYDLGGYRATLLLPMLGGLLCAHAARLLGRRLGAVDEWAAFWLVGVCSPIVIYALDLWEHSLGVGCVLLAAVLLVDVAEGAPPALRAAGAGLLLGIGASMRTEAMVYALVLVGGATAYRLARGRRLGPPVAAGLAAVAGFAVAWAANTGLERAVGGMSRARRASGAASAATGDAANRAGDRVSEALVTSLGMKGDTAASWLLGLAVIAVLLFAVRAHRRGDDRLAAICFGSAGLVYLVSALGDLGFVPGLVAAFPIALAAFLRRPTGPAALLVGIAVGALPLVWAFQYLGGAGPQWGGRYVLVSAVLLGVVGLVSLDAPVLRRGFVGLTAFVTVLGLVWVGVRTRAADDLFTELAAVDADVLVVRDSFLLREAGPKALDEHWLSAADDEEFQQAMQVAIDSGATRIAVVEYGQPAPPADARPMDFREVDAGVLDFTGTPVGVVVYERAGM